MISPSVSDLCQRFDTAAVDDDGLAVMNAASSLVRNSTAPVMSAG